MPAATYSWGETCLPVWPTWLECGYQPASTAAREAPTAAPSESASFSTTAKPSAAPTPRPPETTIADSVSSGRPVETRGVRETTLAALPVKETVTFSTVPAAAEASGAAEFGLTVMTGAPCVTVERTWYEAAKTDWVATGPFS